MKTVSLSNAIFHKLTMESEEYGAVRTEQSPAFFSFKVFYLAFVTLFCPWPVRRANRKKKGTNWNGTSCNVLIQSGRSG